MGQRDDARAALEAQVSRERDQVAELVRREAIMADAFERHTEAGELAEAKAAALAMERRAVERAQAEHRLGELEAALAGHETRDPADAVLDWWSELSAELRGVLGRGRLQAINEGLRELLSSVTLNTTADGSVLVLTNPKQPVSLSALVSGEVEQPREMHAFVATGSELVAPAGLMACAKERNVQMEFPRPSGQG